ncbi:MAG TPA: hypothetical protein VFQ14_02945 [Thermoleophilaceae bacterium]|nr:hypothetical protein [Thermoleophilaceae bacterium]
MRAYSASQVVLGGLLCVVGLAVVVTTLAAGGGPFAIGVLVGVGFAVLGGMRVWIATRGRGPEEER